MFTTKEKQVVFIESYCNEHQLWVNDLPGKDRYLTRGGEARIYLNVDNKHVIKLNEAVYYATWLVFFNSISLHNLIFSNTAYSFQGMIKEQDVLFAVLKQPFITSDAQVDLEDINRFLSYNGFENSKRMTTNSSNWG